MNEQASKADMANNPAEGPRVSPILTLDGQTTKQPVIFRCPNPACIEHRFDPKTGLANHYYDFESDYPECPKCGLGPPAVAKKALIHLLFPDKKGPIVGDMGLRYKLLCDPTRSHLATLDNGEAATGDASCANCPGCLKIVGDKLIQSGQAMSVKPL